ncbi:hypothetical protein BA895_07745 [Humibacillus sp. DSM 29435]|uniref:hypothetical protein n=1 Tax=Humibacillus sp. DSM 29435 TaxID=1869167 RepID=UPI0008728EC9|nr:hypothetical protein [Humibacillus sp. DSM 29435]OFE15021.1 hypothetical protein BA895_07745 [Humibacillus sp. DSM 29435]
MGLVQGSLIFVVIVAVWAAYLVQHWVRRREDAAATRSVDGFSEAMRVLQKRPFLRGPELAEPRPDSYSVTPARSSRATVEVKRAQPVGSARAGSPLTARSTRGSAAITRTTAGTPAGTPARTAAGTAPTQPDHVKVEPMPETHRPKRAPDEQRRPAVSMGQRRLRAALLLVALVWVPTSITLAATNVLTWLSVPFAVLTVAAVLVWLRTEAAADRARGVAGSNAAHPELELATDDTQAVHTHVYAASSGPAAPATVEGEDVATPVVAATVGAQDAPAARRQIASFFDGEAATAVAVGAAGVSTVTAVPAAAAEPLAPGTWSPVPVPRPTYALKAKAEPRLTESGIPADVFATPEFADEADELDERARFTRRAVSG